MLTVSSRAFRALLVGLLALTITATTTGCGSKSSGNTSAAGSTAAQTQSTGTPASPSDTTATQPKTRFAKTKFVLHAGLAFGAFHRYIYKPFRAQGLTPPLRHKAALVKAGLAALFAYHEIKLALKDAKSSPLLSKLVSPLTALQDKLYALRKLRTGRVDAAAITSANTDAAGVSAQSAKAGQPVTDQATPSLGG